MLTKEEIIDIFNNKINNGKLEGCEYLKGLNLYKLIIDFDPGVNDPHMKKSSFSSTCINGNSKEITHLTMDEYLDYDGEIIDIDLSAMARRAS